MKQNIYDELTPYAKKETIYIQIDLSTKRTLSDLITQTKTALSESFDNKHDEVIVYLVCQDYIEINYQEYFKYLKMLLKNIEHVSVYFRGLFHYELIEIFNIASVKINSDCKLVWNETRFATILKAALNNEGMLNSIIQRYITTYHQYPLAYFNIEELKSIGINYEIFE